MGNQASKLYNSQKQYKEAVGPIGGGAGPKVSSDTDSDLLNKSHDRLYNPIDEAERATVSSKINEDAGRYKKGPGPF